MAGIYTMDGDEICTGLRGCLVCDEAIRAAMRHADAIGTDVLLSDDDGDWVVHPAADGRRAPADPCEDLKAGIGD